ncbi:putative bifunctional diguanylate cyclase/phosphodiesterase [Vibrio salinus]|uniref:putative bifunctional diguanylate cyclase/phosphodiesterase n=1 Tax=Vibrio salinus TaxID=2899784 RepID=UPI001E40AC23|nr:GGDEF domain-containing phosphodiesterase [Vibrio salinus]MCE0496061.1 GGDEF domain-containing phosphodiesterase [Vibrio salinus]
MPINELKNSGLFLELLKNWENTTAVFEHYLTDIQLNIWLYNSPHCSLTVLNLKQDEKFLLLSELKNSLNQSHLPTTKFLKPLQTTGERYKCYNILYFTLTDALSNLPIGLITATMLSERSPAQQELNLLQEYCEKIELEVLNKLRSLEQNQHQLIKNELDFHKNYDFGTGFLNRYALERELEQALSKSPNEVAVVYVGFANAKNLQTQFNFYEWEKILKAFADRLSFKIQQDHINIARPNATDIIVLIHSHELKKETILLCEELASISKSIFTINNQAIHLHTHIGVSYSFGTTSVSSLINQASSAMITCKDTGQKYCIHSNLLSESQTRLQHLESYLLKAVRNGDLMLYFQPKVNPLTKRWLAAEALLRWKHPLLGEISSETLIHLAEKNGLIFEVGSFVLKTAIKKAASWKKYAPHFKIAVNISAKQLMDIRFIHQVQKLLETHSLSPESLEIEVTESGLITDEEMAAEVLEELHQLGITLSLDDFGTGYASFNYLKKFPFDCIKIDKSFVETIENNPQDQDIIRSIIQIAKKLDLQVIAEGVETRMQEQFIIEEGCDYGQGYLYGKPMQADVFENKLKTQLEVFELN